MKSIIIRLVGGFMFSLIGNLSFGQISVKILPLTWVDSAITKGVEIPYSETGNINLKALSIEDSMDDVNNIPPRFGYPFEVDIDLNKGIWINKNGKLIWLYRIKTQDSKSINLLFSKFNLPSSAKMFVYHTQSKQLLGAFTEKNNKGNFINSKGFGTGLIYGSEVCIEIDVDELQKDSIVFNLSKVIHGYRYIHIPDKYKSHLSKTTDFSNSGNCMVNVNCVEGANWQDEKRGVAMILVGGVRWCTGSLINNTCNNGIPYFLTADHCLVKNLSTREKWDSEGDNDLSSWSFWWNYESPNCNNPSTEPNADFTNGATLLANNYPSDFALLLLTENPVTSGIDVMYNGWDRTNSPSSGGVGIHHPQGDIKKISTFTDTPSSGMTYSTNEHWAAKWTSSSNGFSVTEGGSSGSPLFLNSGRIIGQLHGGPSSCQLLNSKKYDDYGRFSVSYNSNPNIHRQLDHWLGSCESTESIGGGFSYCDDYQNINNLSTNINQYFSTIETNVSCLVPSNTSVKFTSEGKVKLLPGFKASSGSYTRAYVTPCQPSVHVINKPIPPTTSDNNSLESKLSKVNPRADFTTLFPNPATDKFSIIENNMQKIESVIIYNVLGQEVLTCEYVKDIDINNLKNGLYFVYIKYFNTFITLPLNIQH